MPQANPFDGVRGSVRRVETYHGADGSRSVTRYDRAGRVTLSEHQSPGRPASRNSTFFDSSGRMTGTASEYGEEKRLVSRHVYDNGQLVRIEYQHFDGSPAQPILVEEKPDGGRIHTIPLLGLPKSVEGREIGYDITVTVPGAATRTEEYDSEGRRTLTTFLDRDGKLLSTTHYSYDEAGRIIDENQTWEGENLIFEKLRNEVPTEIMGAIGSLFDGRQGRRTTYRYDTAGNEVEQHSTFPPLVEMTVRSEYNEQGDISGRSTESGRRGFQIGQGGVRETEDPPAVERSDFAYEYDERGNWIRRVTRSHQQGGVGETRENVDARVVEYYD